MKRLKEITPGILAWDGDVCYLMLMELSPSVMECAYYTNEEGRSTTARYKEALTISKKITHRGIEVEIQVIVLENKSWYIEFEALEITNSLTYIPLMASYGSQVVREVTKALDVMLDSKNLDEVLVAEGAKFNGSKGLSEVEPISIITNKTSDLRDEYLRVIGTVSEINESINADSILADKDELAKMFIKAESEIRTLASFEDNKYTAAFRRFAYNTGWTKSLVDKVSIGRSIQESIDSLFGLVSVKYDELLKAGEQLQHSRVLLLAQITALDELVLVSTEALSKYPSQIDIPTSELALDTQIKSSAEKLRARVVKLEAVIIAAQGTILAFGKDLPSLKTDLTDEMALASVLGTLQDSQSMYTSVTDLITSVAEDTSNNSHKVIEELMDMQINDTHTSKYIADSLTRGSRTAKMVEEKTIKLRDKVTKDAEYITSVVSSKSHPEVGTLPSWVKLKD